MTREQEKAMFAKRQVDTQYRREYKYTTKTAPAGWNLEADTDDYMLYDSNYGMSVLLEKQYDDRWLVSFENTSKDVIDTDAVTTHAAATRNFDHKDEAIDYARRFMRRYQTADAFHKDFPASSTEYDDRVLDYQ